MWPRQISLLLLCLSGYIPQAISAANVSVNGKVISSTCTIDVNGNADTLVTLNKIQVGDLGLNASRENTPFRINITDCADVTENTLQVKLTRTGAAHYSNGIPNTGTAKNVELALRKQPDEAAVTFSGETSLLDVPSFVGGKAAIDMIVQYVSWDMMPTPGTVTSALKFDLSYK